MHIYIAYCTIGSFTAAPPSGPTGPTHTGNAARPPARCWRRRRKLSLPPSPPFLPAPLSPSLSVSLPVGIATPPATLRSGPTARRRTHPLDQPQPARRPPHCESPVSAASRPARSRCFRADGTRSYAEPELRISNRPASRVSPAEAAHRRLFLRENKDGVCLRAAAAAAAGSSPRSRRGATSDSGGGGRTGRTDAEPGPVAPRRPLPPAPQLSPVVWACGSNTVGTAGGRSVRSMSGVRSMSVVVANHVTAHRSAGPGTPARRFSRGPAVIAARLALNHC